MSITYAATSLADIADGFDLHARSARALASRAITLRGERENKARAEVWEAAAAVLRNTELKA